ncbi:MAG: hypothetical protein UV38_C0002G0155 [candidate division TM6 bacterium GW2011_GWE2_42_60]|nr:MAG: hypothetical protein UV38_C0002G0155 [candidate division TM6 bacterium GW2011_GWE2_42_60]HBY06087.1 hypothetical protein [Candidatus Dependentiae bacterium]
METDCGKKASVCRLALVVLCAISISAVTQCMDDKPKEVLKKKEYTIPLWRKCAAGLVTTGVIGGLSYGAYLLGKKGCPVAQQYGLDAWSRRTEIMQLALALVLKTKTALLNHPCGIICGVGSVIALPMVAPYGMIGAQGVYSVVAGKSYLEEKHLIVQKRIDFARGLLKDLQKKYDSVVKIAKITEGSCLPTNTSLKVREQADLVKEGSLLTKLGNTKHFCLYRWLRPLPEYWWNFEECDEEGSFFTDRCSGIKGAINRLLAAKKESGNWAGVNKKSQKKSIEIKGNNNELKNVNQNNIATGPLKAIKLTPEARKNVQNNIALFAKEYEHIAHPLLSMIRRDSWKHSWCKTLQSFGL